MVEVEKLNSTIEEFEGYVSNIKTVSQTLSEIEQLYQQTKINKQNLDNTINSIIKIEDMLQNNLMHYKLDTTKINQELSNSTKEMKAKIDDLYTEIDDKNSFMFHNIIKENKKNMDIVEQNIIQYIDIENKSIKSKITDEIQRIKSENEILSNKLFRNQIVNLGLSIAIIALVLFLK
ncbi:protein of unknown function [Acetoanaerobium sticklandii]|uniref:Uncharacterized protein n=1 Tax=Acetoanaerobium sticklandii (strain ATCC 12662 / DSM 519 / JCM 1433 / CCUG 9281 / NCIMB 10654 / HF) TaxID=499177 RepID=E3PY60_ACESD|nr:hypothetical protein [Acetoanaerobium sticklandii]CBH21375.1 protein of unknown function [Acetoanaerobium sticklandii]